MKRPEVILQEPGPTPYQPNSLSTEIRRGILEETYDSLLCSFTPFDRSPQCLTQSARKRIQPVRTVVMAFALRQPLGLAG